MHASLVAQRVKRLPTMQETWVRSLGQEDLLEKEMATHSSTLAWKIPWMEKPGRLQSMGLQRIGHDWTTSLSLSHHFRRASQGAQWQRIYLLMHEMRRHRFDLWFGKIPWRKEMAIRSSIHAGKFHGEGSVVGYSPWFTKSWTWLRERACTQAHHFGTKPVLDV